jgi:hypothetical protein
MEIPVVVGISDPRRRTVVGSRCLGANDGERPDDVLPEPDKLISYRQVGGGCYMIPTISMQADRDGFRLLRPRNAIRPLPVVPQYPGPEGTHRRRTERRSSE